MTDEGRAWLERIARSGTWPDRPFLNDPEGIALMLLGLVEAIDPPQPALPYVTLTPAGRRLLGSRTENSHIWQREEHGHYVEPEWCSRRLFNVEYFKGPIWDPACGFGRIPEVARAVGLGSYAADIVDRGYDGLDRVEDFLACDGQRMPAEIVTNPPFDLIEQFARKALSFDHVRKVAMIWLTRRLNAARWLQDTPLVRIYYLTPRPSMPPGHVIARGEKPGGGKQDFCWLVWAKGHRGPATVSWLYRDAK